MGIMGLATDQIREDPNVTFLASLLMNWMLDALLGPERHSNLHYNKTNIADT